MTGAGGVGGLLMVQEGGNSYLPAYDGNGNVHAMIKASDGSIAAAYDGARERGEGPSRRLARRARPGLRRRGGRARQYDAFGNTLRESGLYAASNPFRFSTKYTDTETSLVYYGLRYYSPSLGRFINRDPIEEQGGLNLYAFVRNNSVNHWDYLGMVPQDRHVFAPGDDEFDRTRAVIRGNRVDFQGMMNAFNDMAWGARIAANFAEGNKRMKDAADAVQRDLAKLAEAQRITANGGSVTVVDANGNAVDISSGSGTATSFTYNGQAVSVYSPAGPNNTATTNTGTNLTTAVVAGTVITAPGTLAGGGAAGGELIAAGARAGAVGAAIGVILSIPGDTAATASRTYEGMPVYRVWGGASGPLGQSWTPADPRIDQQNYRELAGLPHVNTGQYLATGILIDNKGVIYMPALPLDPSLGGSRGGWPEIRVPSPGNQIQIVDPKINLPPPINTTQPSQPGKKS